MPLSTPSTKRLPVTPTALLGALAAILFSIQCGPASSDPAESGAGRSPTPLPFDQGVTDEPRPPAGTVPSFEETLGIGRPTEREAPKPLFQELAFEVQAEGLATGGSWRENPLLADLDGDGCDDVVASNREEDGLNIWRSLRGEGWELRIDGIARNLMYGGSDAADLDHDGDVDLVFASHKRVPRVFLNEGGEMRWREIDTLDSPHLAIDVALGNLNGDEHVDAITIAQFAVSRGNGPLGVYLGRGDGTFDLQRHLQFALGRSRSGQQAELVDIDGDGLDDPVLTAEYGAVVLLSRVDEEGALSFESFSEGLPKPVNIGNIFRSVIAADFTGDGQPEVAFCGLADPKIPDDERNHAGIFRWTGGKWEQFDRGLPRHVALRDIVAADFDDDGHNDLLLCGPGYGAVIFLGDGTGGFTPRGMLPGSIEGGRADLGDVNADGMVDVLLTHAATKRAPKAGGVRVYVNRAEAWE